MIVSQGQGASRFASATARLLAPLRAIAARSGDQVGDGDGSELWVVVGLGNPGREYADTRHNMGFRVVDELARRHGIDVGDKKHRSLVGSGTIGGQPVLLVKPQTFMNESGRALQGVASFRKVSPRRIVVVYDDVDLPLGRVRVRPRGSAGGHHGIESAIRELGSQEFGRVRIGIGRPAERDVTDFVLHPFHATERDEADQAVARAADAVEQIVTEGFEQAMQAVNR